MRSSVGGLLLVAGCAVGCTGSLDGGDGSEGTPGGSPGDNPGGVDLTCDREPEPGVTPLLKLTTRQYRNTVRDLLSGVGADDVLEDLEGLLGSVPEDTPGSSFRGRDDRISLEHVEAYFNVGVTVGDAVVEDPDVLRAVAGDCALESELGEECIDDFLSRFVQRAYRRPLTDEEAAELGALNDGERTPAEAIRAMLVVALSSPAFVNHVEIEGVPVEGSEGLLQLTAYETASRLSYTFWHTMPDAELFAAAEDGSLETPEGFAAQLERVFHDERTRETLWDFWEEWLKLGHFTGFEFTRPGFQAFAAGESVGEEGHDHYGDMLQEVRDLTSLFTFDEPGTVRDLLTTDISVTQSADLARLYGVEPWSGSGEYPTFSDGTRAGLLQRGALLVSSLEQTNPFHRGAFLRRNVLCDPLPSPDPNALPPGALDTPPVTGLETTRQRYEAKVDGNPLCSTCHDMFSDVGYVMESFDSLGRYRSVERVFDEQTGEELGELPIDTSADLQILASVDPVEGPADLNDLIVQSGRVEACMASKFFEFAMRRTAPRQSIDWCAVQDLTEGLADPEVGLAGALQRVAQYPSFFLRKVGPQ